ncbi:hypothetical protein [Dethiobacter alkaliphilus]|uniref:Uncharacterized protein n=1 Tax=Dethiobacter alkaliphilus AHT 1 TaxID=555088 RepID=C0GI23_DETAL|nr:hypothetical protein [Dethiobacter alkaliphilus]EEG77097.1 hypothetical protein DealDRAFT_2132 [Dethiobacter alkaliphilus AHT 1]
MISKKASTLLIGCFVVSLILNAVLIHNTLSLRDYLKNEYIEAFSNLNEQNPWEEVFSPWLALGHLRGVGAALDKQFRIR